MTPHEAISFGLWAHQWEGIGAPSDECECCADVVLAGYTNDPAVRSVARALIVYVAVYQLFDALQTVAAYALRGYKITFAPMFVHVVCFWVVGLLGGWWLAFRGSAPMGVAGFWAAMLASLMLAAALLGGLLWRAVRAER